MAKSAYVVLGRTGAVVRTHSGDIGGNAAGPAVTTGATDLETLINLGYLAERETRLDGGGVLVVLRKP